MYNISMDDLIFEWDENKNLSNQKKHGISFEEAQEVFYDDDAILFDDPDNSEYEDRFLLIGVTQKRASVHCQPPLSRR